MNSGVFSFAKINNNYFSNENKAEEYQIRDEPQKSGRLEEMY